MQNETVLRFTIQCEDCEGSGKVWFELYGANILTTKECESCLGFGLVFRTIRLSQEEQQYINRIIKPHLLKNNEPVSPQ